MDVGEHSGASPVSCFYPCPPIVLSQRKSYQVIFVFKAIACRRQSPFLSRAVWQPTAGTVFCSSPSPCVAAPPSGAQPARRTSAQPRTCPALCRGPSQRPNALTHTHLPREGRAPRGLLCSPSRAPNPEATLPDSNPGLHHRLAGDCTQLPTCFSFLTCKTDFIASIPQGG